MKTMLDVINALLAMSDPCLSEFRAAYEETPPEVMEEWQISPIDPMSVELLSETIGAITFERLSGISGDDLYERVYQDGKKTLELLYGLVKDLGIPREAVFAPISVADRMEKVGLVKVEDGLVTLSEDGEKVAEEVGRGIKESQS